MRQHARRAAHPVSKKLIPYKLDSPQFDLFFYFFMYDYLYIQLLLAKILLKTNISQ